MVQKEHWIVAHVLKGSTISSGSKTRRPLRRIWAYAALHQSGEIDRSGHVSKCGDKLMRHALYDAANSHLRISKKWWTLRAWGVKLAKRVGEKKTCVAVARKLAIIMHRMRVEETDFRFGNRLPRKLRKDSPSAAVSSAEDVGKVSPSRSL
jgi:Transposase IS116/IS110/IS902 family